MKQKNKEEIYDDINKIIEFNNKWINNISNKLLNTLSNNNFIINDNTINNNKEEYSEYIKALRKTKKLSKKINSRKDWSNKFWEFNYNFEKITLLKSYDANAIQENKNLITQFILPRQQIAWIQLMFLWFKPILDLNFNRISIEQQKKIWKLFESYWFKTSWYEKSWKSIIVYNENLVKKTINKYKHYFWENTIKSINSDIWKLNDIELWLLFGYPIESCLWYLECKNKSEIKKNRTIKKAQSYLTNYEDNNEYWFTFLRHNPGKETKKLMKEVKLAFQESKILEKRNTLKNKN